MSIVALASAFALALPAAASAETDVSTTGVHTTRADTVHRGRSAGAAHRRATSATREASATGTGTGTGTTARRPSRVLPAPSGRGGGPASGDHGCSGADRSSNGHCAAPDLAPGAPQENNEVVPGASGTHGDGASIGPQGSLPGNGPQVQ